MQTTFGTIIVTLMPFLLAASSALGKESILHYPETRR